MDEDKPLPQTNSDKKAKAAIDNELANFLKPKSEQKTLVGAETVGAVVAAENKPINELSSSIPTQTSSPINNPSVKKPIIRTYKTDMEETIQEGHLSSINIAISENNKILKGVTADVIETKKWKLNKNLVIISVILVIAGGLTLLVPYAAVQNQSNSTTQTPTDTFSAHTLITADLDEKINIADLNLGRVAVTLEQHVEQSSTQLGQIKNIILTEGAGVNEQSLTADEFLKLIQAHIPANLERTLKNEYMFGLHNYSGNQEFLILKVGEYDTAFSSMLSWEDNLWQDFKVLFHLQDTTPVAIDTTTPASTSSNLGSTTPSSPDTSSVNPFIIEVKKFQDASFGNKDCRVVKNAQGKVIFLYSIVDANTIVITTSTETLKEVISRLNQTNSSTQ